MFFFYSATHLWDSSTVLRVVANCAFLPIFRIPVYGQIAIDWLILPLKGMLLLSFQFCLLQNPCYKHSSTCLADTVFIPTDKHLGLELPGHEFQLQTFKSSQVILNPSFLCGSEGDVDFLVSIADPPAWALDLGPWPSCASTWPSRVPGTSLARQGITLLIEISFICESRRVHLLSCAKEVRPAFPCVRASLNYTVPFPRASLAFSWGHCPHIPPQNWLTRPLSKRNWNHVDRVRLINWAQSQVQSKH